MPITVNGRGGTVTITLSGEIDHHGARAMMLQLDEAIASRLPMRLTLDLSGVTFMDSSGIAVLLRAQRSVQNLGGSVIVCRVPRQAKRVMDAAGIGRLMTIQAGGTDDEK